MNITELKHQVLLGEDSTRQFKADVKNPDGLASEMVAFANAQGGTLFIGVDDDSNIIGLEPRDLKRINSMVGNVASHNVRSAITVYTENVLVDQDRVVVVIKVPAGIDKPYFDKNGVIWLKAGADKRRICSKEELRRIFQVTDQFHADELPTKATLEQLDIPRLRTYLREQLAAEWPDDPGEQIRLMKNLNLAADDGQLNLAGLLLFGSHPERIKPQFVLKAVAFPGRRIEADTYLDAEEYAGNLTTIFTGAMAFINRNLHKVPSQPGFNAPSRPEIPLLVFEELLVNALIHRDYLVDAPIRLLVYTDRIEVISPGHLPNQLNVAKILTGNSVMRNPILVSYGSKGLLPYHGIGSGIRRASAAWPHIMFNDDRDGCQFTALVTRFEQLASESPSIGDIGDKQAAVSPIESPNISDISDKQAAVSPIESPNNSDIGDNTAIMAPKESPNISDIGDRQATMSPIESPNIGDNTDADIETRIMNLLKLDVNLSTYEIADRLNVNRRTVARHIDKLKQHHRLVRVGTSRGGHWIILD